MVQKKRSAAKIVEARYAELVKVQDAFWRETFPQFVEQLKGCFQDPNAAAARLISRYLEAPQSLAHELASTPEAFGALAGETDREHAALLAQTIMADATVVTLAHCAAAFVAVRSASGELDKMRLTHPQLFHSLQRRRALRNQNRPVPAPIASPPAASIKHYAGLSRYFGVRSSFRNSTPGTS